MMTEDLGSLSLCNETIDWKENEERWGEGMLTDSDKTINFAFCRKDLRMGSFKMEDLDILLIENMTLFNSFEV